MSLAPAWSRCGPGFRYSRRIQILDGDDLWDVRPVPPCWCTSGRVRGAGRVAAVRGRGSSQSVRRIGRATSRSRLWNSDRAVESVRSPCQDNSAITPFEEASGPVVTWLRRSYADLRRTLSESVRPEPGPSTARLVTTTDYPACTTHALHERSLHSGTDPGGAKYVSSVIC